MPNWYYIGVNGLYLLGVSVWTGGVIVISGVVSPALFRSLPRHEAALASASILWKFARMRAVLLILIIIGAGTKFAVWERSEIAPWMIVRWSAIALMAWALVVELRRHRPLQVLGSSFTPALPADDPLREVFDLFRIGAEGLMNASLVASLIALLFS